MPSAVVLMHGELRTGQAAENAHRSHPDAFEANPKRLLGDERVHLGGEVRRPAELVAAVLATVRSKAMRLHRDEPPTRVWLTHPASWGAARTDALREAARLAGFDPATVQLVPEPVAALRHHLADRELPVGARVAVIDVGGGTTDVAVLEHVAAGGYVLVGLAADDLLGGRTFDAALAGWVLQQLRRRGETALADAIEHGDSLGDRLAFDRSVKSAKEDLSGFPYADVHVAAGGREATLTVTRAEYEALIEPELARLEQLVTDAVTDVGGGIAAVHLTGGASATPAVVARVQRATGVLPSTIDDPKLVVAEGALSAAEAPQRPPITWPAAPQPPAAAPPAVPPPPPAPVPVSMPAAAAPTIAAPPASVPPRASAHPPTAPRRQRSVPIALVIAASLAALVLVGGAVGIGVAASQRGAAPTTTTAAPPATGTTPTIPPTEPTQTTTDTADPAGELVNCWDGSDAAPGACPALEGLDAFNWAFLAPGETEPLCVPTSQPIASPTRGLAEGWECSWSDLPGIVVELTRYDDRDAARLSWIDYFEQFPADSYVTGPLTITTVKSDNEQIGRIWIVSSDELELTVRGYDRIPFYVAIGFSKLEGGQTGTRRDYKEAVGRIAFWSNESLDTVMENSQ